MEVLEAIRTRRSIRAFDPARPVPEEVILQILEAGIWAPSAGNIQPWEFIVVRDERVKRELSMAALFQEFVAEAPVVIVVVADQARSASRYRERGRSLYCIQDTAAAIQNMLLATHSLGFGACWVGAFDEVRAKGILSLPEHKRPVALIPLGFPRERPSAPSRRSLKSVTRFL